MNPTTPPNPDTARIHLTHVRQRRSGLIAQIRSCRSGLLNLQCAALAAKDAGEVDGRVWQAVEGWTASDRPAALLDAVEAAMMTVPNAQPLRFPKYPEEEGTDPLFPESVILGEDRPFLETAAEIFSLQS